MCVNMMSISNHVAYLSKQFQALSKKSKSPSPLWIQCQHLMNYIQYVPEKSGLLQALFQDIKKHTVKDFPLFIERVIQNFKSDVHLALVEKQVGQFQRHKNLYRVSNIFVFMGTVLGGGVLSHLYGWYAIPVWIIGALMFNGIEKRAEQKFNQVYVIKKAQVGLVKE
jgi:hypothetical protein